MIDDGIRRTAGVSFYIYLEFCMIFCSISGGECESLPLSGETELDGSRSRRDYETGACSQESIGDLYFRKFDNLDDSLFQSVLEHELARCSCGALEVIPKVLFLNRALVGQGSHRSLATSFRFELPVESRFEIQAQSRKAIFVERLPHGVFADPFELQHLKQHGEFKDACFFGDTNLELPSFLSNRSLVEIHIDLNSSNWSNNVEFNLKLPLHGRYQSLDDSGYTNVEFKFPDIFLRCKLNDGTRIKSCISALKDNGRLPKRKTITWRLPSGIKAHEGVVSVVTFFSALVSALLIVFVSVWHL